MFQKFSTYNSHLQLISFYNYGCIIILEWRFYYVKDNLIIGLADVNFLNFAHNKIGNIRSSSNLSKNTKHNGGNIMKKLWTILALSLLLLAGCSSGQKETSGTDGESLYNRSCASCHGTDLKGISGPPLLNLSSKYSDEQVQKIIKDGVNMMPGKLLTDEESQTVTKWLMEK